MQRTNQFQQFITLRLHRLHPLLFLTLTQQIKMRIRNGKAFFALLILKHSPYRSAKSRIIAFFIFDLTALHNIQPIRIIDHGSHADKNTR